MVKKVEFTVLRYHPYIGPGIIQGLHTSGGEAALCQLPVSDAGKTPMGGSPAQSVS